MVTFTTVGYGDVTPKTPSGRGFATLFALFSMAVLGVALVTFVSALLEAEAAVRKRLLDASLRSLDRLRSRSRRRALGAWQRSGGRPGRRAHPTGQRPAAAGAPGEPIAIVAAQQRAPAGSGAGAEGRQPAGGGAGEEEVRREEVSLLMDEQVQTPFQFALTAFRLAQPIVVCTCLLVALGCAVEGFSLVDGLYFAIISVTTVGFGDLSPQTASGRALACVLLPISVASTAKAVSSLIYHAQLQALLIKTQDITKLLSRSGAASLTEVEFVLHVLVALYDVDSKVADALRAQFRALDKDGNGVLDSADLGLLAPHRQLTAPARAQAGHARRAPPDGLASARPEALPAVGQPPSTHSVAIDIHNPPGSHAVDRTPARQASSNSEPAPLPHSAAAVLPAPQLALARQGDVRDGARGADEAAGGSCASAASCCSGLERRFVTGCMRPRLPALNRAEGKGGGAGF